jgi:hypothetical protein
MIIHTFHQISSLHSTSHHFTSLNFTKPHSPFFYATLVRVYWEKPRKFWVCRRRSEPGTTRIWSRSAEISIAKSGEREDLSSVNTLSVYVRHSEVSAGHMYHFYAHKILHFSRAQTSPLACTTFNQREGSDMNIFSPLLLTYTTNSRATYVNIFAGE